MGRAELSQLHTQYFYVDWRQGAEDTDYMFVFCESVRYVWWAEVQQWDKKLLVIVNLTGL